MILDTSKQYSRACSGSISRRASSRNCSAISCGSIRRNLARRTHRHTVNAAALRRMTPTVTTAQAGTEGRCLGCRISRMSPSEEAGTWGDSGADGVKVVRLGLALTGAEAVMAGLAAGAATWRAEALSEPSNRLKALGRLPRSRPLGRVGGVEVRDQKHDRAAKRHLVREIQRADDIRASGVGLEEEDLPNDPKNV